MAPDKAGGSGDEDHVFAAGRPAFAAFRAATTGIWLERTLGIMVESYAR